MEVRMTVTSKGAASRALTAGMAFTLAVCFLLLSPAVISAQPVRKPLTLEAMLSIKSIGSVAISPSGRTVAFDVTTADWNQNRYTTDVWLADVETGKTFAVTHGPDMNMAVAWSPDGACLTFLSTRRGKPQIFAFRPGFGEAELLVEAPGGVRKYAWSPDGKSIAFLTPEAPDAQKAAQEKAGFDAVAGDTSAPRSQLHLFDVATKTIKVLVAGDFHIMGFSWSPDSSRLAFVTSPKNIEFVTWDSQTLRVVNRDGSGLAALDFPYYAAYTRRGEAIWSPDGRFLGLEVGDVTKPELYNPIIQLYDFATGRRWNASGQTDHFLYNCRWASDGEGIYYIAYDLLNSQIFRLDLKTKTARQMTHFPKIEINALSFAADGRTMAFSASTPDRPQDIYVGDINDADKARRLTDMHPELQTTWLGETEEISWRSADGLQIFGNIVYPLGYVKGKAYPTVTLIHGGPAGNFNNSFAAIYYCPAQYFAGQGYLVYMPDVRGSIGWGSEFMRKDIRDWGGGDYRDLMAGLDTLIARGLADKDRLVVWGGSYGGYMTNWIVTQTNRFKAAHAEVSISDLQSLWSLSPIGRILFRQYFGKTPLEDPEIYRKLSPLTYAARVKTPLLLTQNANDERVAATQALEFYRAVQTTGTPVEYYMYPNETHGTMQPNHQLDKLRKTEAWFKKYLK
jgi:dipeptidyl aminopeptidase/acylaminoacyl peptidase